MTVSAGATGVFHCVCMGLLLLGDEVILFEPYYGYHLSTILAEESVPRIVSLQVLDRFLSMEALEKTITNRTKAVVVNTPSNPSGKVFTTPKVRRNCSSSPSA